MKQVKAVALAVGTEAIAGRDVLAAATLLSDDAKNPSYLYFHIDNEDSDGKPGIVAHLHFSARPKTPPPKGAERLLKEGRTVEWLSTALAAIAGRTKPAVLADAKLVMELATRPRGAVLGPYLATPVALGGPLLEMRGIEYRCSPAAEREAEQGLTRFRWLQQERRTWAWLSYVHDWSLPADPWQTAGERCQTYLRELF
jgi:hypothetical protein